ncbi:MAG: helix-turn-helix domain-containing protein [Planctomycetota bacterium]
MPDSDDVNLVMRAIADPVRRSIIDLLSDGTSRSLFSICVDLSQNSELHLSRQAVTKHLNVLESAGLLDVEWQGRTKLHTFNGGPLKALGKGWLKKYLK